MCQDERQSEQFIREVDEELRRAQLKSIWDRFAPLIIGVCVLVVLVTAGYRGWLWWEERQAAAAGDRFMAAMEAIESGNRAEGEAEIARIAEEGRGGYAALARLRLAGEKAAAGSKAEALAAYDAVAADASVAPTLRDVARIRAALLALDSGDVAGAKERAAPLDTAGNPWRHAAREVLGMAAYKSGELQTARDYFSAIQQDAETPRGPLVPLGHDGGADRRPARRARHRGRGNAGAGCGRARHVGGSGFGSAGSRLCASIGGRAGHAACTFHSGARGSRRAGPCSAGGARSGHTAATNSNSAAIARQCGPS